MKRFVSAALGIALASIAGSSQAADVTGQLGEKGTIAIHAATGSPMLSSSTALPIFGGFAGATPTLGLATTKFEDREVCNNNNTVCTTDRTSVTAFYLNPRVHYFVIDHLSIGADLLIASFSAETETETRNTVNGVALKETVKQPAPGMFGLMPIIGYEIALGSKVSIWPQGGIGFRRANWKRYNGGRELEDSESWWFLNVDVPFVVHIAPHFELGAGPGVTLTLAESRDIADNNNVTRSYNGFSTTQFRWLNAHLIGYF